MRVVEHSVISSTFGGDTIGLAAAKAVLSVYETKEVIATLWARGQQLMSGFTEMCTRLGIPAGLFGYAPMGYLQFVHPDTERNQVLFLRFNAEILKRGVIIYNVCYPNFSHQESDMAIVLEVMENALVVMREDGLFD